MHLNSAGASKMSYTPKAWYIQQVMSNVNGASFVGIDTVTVPTLKGGKGNPMQGKVEKHNIGSSVMVFQNKTANGYENMVHRRLIAEGRDPASFVLGERPWGKRIPNTPFIEHQKDGVVKHYLEVIFLKSGDVHYTLDGAPILEQDIIGLQEKAVNEDSQGGLNNKVIIRTIGLDSITKIRIDGQEFVGPFKY